MTHTYDHKKTQKDSASPSKDAPTTHHSSQTSSPAGIPLWARLAYGNAVHPALQLSAERLAGKANTTGLPETLKTGIENLSGLSMDDVQVHYNSSKPAQVQALAYTQGTEIHVRPGQEQHLAHEAWHVVQQMQGRVQPTLQAMGVKINDDQKLEEEADVMGGRAVREGHAASIQQQIPERLSEIHDPTIIARIAPTLATTSMKEQSIIGSTLLIQRKGTQIGWQNQKIKYVEVYDRPGPAGAHVTAWALLTHEVRKALFDQGFDGALTGLWKLTNAIPKLALYSSGPAWLKKQLDPKVDKLKIHIENLAKTPPADLEKTQTIQELSDQYLYLRNLVPGTVDTLRSSTNRGEKTFVDDMEKLAAAYADPNYDEKKKSLTVDAFADACWKTFDPPNQIKGDLASSGQYLAQHLQTTFSTYSEVYPIREDITAAVAKIASNKLNIPEANLIKEIDQYPFW